MKKKYLNSLDQLEKWLSKELPSDTEFKSAIELLKTKIQALETKKAVVKDEELPLPVEIAETHFEYALYADGACRGNPGPGANAFVIQDRTGKVLAEGVGFENLTTNNKMELRGVLGGLKELEVVVKSLSLDPRLSKVRVVTDSKYVVEGMRSWLKGWKNRGWKKADNKAPENLELWQLLDEASNLFFCVDWMWVKGHAGHSQNEYCDRKANETIDSHT